MTLVGESPLICLYKSPRLDICTQINTKVLSTRSSYTGGTKEEGKKATKGVENSHSFCTACCKKRRNNKAGKKKTRRRIQVARIWTPPRHLSCINAEQTTHLRQTRADDDSPVSEPSRRQTMLAADDATCADRSNRLLRRNVKLMALFPSKDGRQVIDSGSK